MSEARNPRTAGRAGDRRADRMNRPPEGSQWVWVTIEMLGSPAWRALPLQALRVLSRVLIEHAAHGGTKNGDLVVTYDDFEAYGVRRKGLPAAIAAAVALGFLDAVTGHRNVGAGRYPSLYGITWIGRADGSPASNRWKSIVDDAQANEMIRVATEGCMKASPLHVSAAPRRKAPLPRSIK